MLSFCIDAKLAPASAPMLLNVTGPRVLLFNPLPLLNIGVGFNIS